VSEERLELDLRAREKRIYDRLRARVVSLEPAAKPGVRDLLLFLPDLVVLLLRLMRDPRVPIGAKSVAAMGIAYTLSPIDLVPEILFGPIGFLDDVLIAAAAVSWIVNRVHPDLVRANWPGSDDVLDVVKRVLGWSEGVVGKTLGRLFRFREIG
jgi:uncharacterized membrane protein YkvA (DUF1232 family)